ncbi:MAG TPA: hypothetical protein PK597_00870 [Oscillospiraceae bacterium]|nr:hypothetical protein [Oscillospiraceae bacterium]
MKKPVARPVLLLTELILDLFIFVVCTAVCAGLLVKARGMSRDAQQLTAAVAVAQTAAENLRAGASVSSLSGLGADGGYAVEILDRGAGDGASGYEITVSYDGRAVYTLETGG